MLIFCLSLALAAAPTLRHVATHTLLEGTHRPEMLALPDGGVMGIVVQPDATMGTGRVKHRAYGLDANWNPVGEPFIVTRITEEFGEPADHRAAIVNGELVVFYQSLIFDGVPLQGGPAENGAREQSLMMARFA